MPVTQPIIASEQFAFGAKSESSYGTQATLADATDYIYVSKADLKINNKNIARDYKTPNLLALPEALGEVTVGISIAGEFQGGASATVPNPVMDALLLASGYHKSVVAGGVQYTPESTAPSGSMPGPGISLTASCYYRGYLLPVKGVQGAIKLTAKADGLVEFAFDGTGLYVAGTGSQTFPSPTLTNNYVNSASGSLSTMGYDPDWSSFEFDSGVKTQTVPYAGVQYGVGKVMVVKHAPTLKFDPLADSALGHDFIANSISKTTGSIAFSAGTVAGRRIALSFPTAQYQSVDLKERDNLVAYDVTAKPFGTYTITLS